MSQTNKIVYQRPPLYPKQEEAIFCEARYGVIEAGVQTGKAQPLYSKIYTPDGPRLMGNIRVGDEVSTPDGGSATVVGVYPQGVTDNYKVTLSDGRWVEASGDHLWTVETYGGTEKTVTTTELAQWSDRKLKEHWTPMPDPVRFTEQSVPIDPWFLGILISEGGLSTKTLKFSSSDPEIVGRVEAVVEPYYSLKGDGGNTYKIVANNPKAAQSVAESVGVYERSGRFAAYFNSSHIGTFDTRAEARSERDKQARSYFGSEWVPVGDRLIHNLRELGLWGARSHEKFIPDCYKYNTKQTRLEVLRGILDGDGWVSKKSGQPRLEQTSRRLAEDVRETIESLGGICGLNTKEGSYKRDNGSVVECKTVYRLSIQYPDAPSLFWLSRKKDATRRRERRVVRRLKGVDRVDDTYTQCIEIDSDDSLYLTDNFIATHNTVGCIAWLVEQALIHGGEGRNYWWVAPVSDQANIAFRRMVHALPRSVVSHKISASGKERIELINGSTIWFKSADKSDSLFGESVYAAVIDEASRVKQESWHAVRSRLAATNGPIRIIGNVKGRKNWHYDLARRAEAAESNEKYHYAKITAFDAAEAGVIDYEEIEEARESLPEGVFRELYLAEPGDDEGNPFGLDHIRACILTDDKGNRTNRTAQGTPVSWGWDVAKSTNYTVGIGLNRAGEVCRFERWQGASWEQTIRRIVANTSGVSALVDATTTGGDQQIEALRREGGHNFRGYKFTTNSKQELMLGLAMAIQRREIQYPDGPIVQELEIFEYERRRDRILYSAPKGAHDDCVDALALAVKNWDRGMSFDASAVPIQSVRSAPFNIA